MATRMVFAWLRAETKKRHTVNYSDDKEQQLSMATTACPLGHASTGLGRSLALLDVACGFAACEAPPGIRSRSALTVVLCASSTVF
jgi:hypothetical protein